ncbi:winged helix DNA-binding protein [Novosphingobium sp. MD-1]|uniref:winged helix DNA-binding protein n=1 Tax=Novosphingobium sp. MD-1 TaxID=1630648 RepID=UPI00061C78E9|nr:winged helix DNA-binding protein [Novosphingobium sp. MD-1]GAO53733.1 hypothetical protein NMD1_00739 [Novosphingobium sp. MD-1]
MGQSVTRFDYDDSTAIRSDRARAPLAVAIFADQPFLRAELAEDVTAAGLRVVRSHTLGALLDDPEDRGVDDLVLVDCPVVDAAELAALSRLDMLAARGGAQVVVSTSLDSLEAVFGCLDQSQPDILVAPSRADRMIALGSGLARRGKRVRELDDEDRLTLLRLTEQVSEIARTLARLSGEGDAEGAGGGTVEDKVSAFRFDGAEAGGARDRDNGRLARATRPPLPDPRLIRRIARQRQLRARFFQGDLFADPAWDMLLDLTAARAEHARVSVTSLCIASGVPPTTALRWIAQMTDAGLFRRVEDDTDRRRAFIALTDRAADAMARYFAEIGVSAPMV